MIKQTYNFQFPKNSTHLIVGPSGSGKTSRIVEMLRHKNEIFEDGKQINNVIFCYSVWQPLYDFLDKENIITKWHHGLPNNEEFKELVDSFKDFGGSICIMDDFLTQINKDLVEIVCVTSRHMNTSTFILSQSLFSKNPFLRQISVNVKFLHLLKNPREVSQFQYLARQISPVNNKWIIEAYQEATRKPYSCFLIDLCQTTNDSFRFRSNYLPSQFPMKIWMNKNTIV